jgi:hypothetical protein
MPPSARHRTVEMLAERLRNADAVTAGLLYDVISETCRRLPALRRTKSFDRLEHLIQSDAWTDAVLALLALELPQWQLRRVAYDEGEWHCALSRQPELPDWFDQPVEACHTDLALAILSAFVDVQRFDTSSAGTSAPAFPGKETPVYLPFCCDNFS